MTERIVILCILICASMRGTLQNATEEVPHTITIHKPLRESYADDCDVGLYGTLCTDECHCLMDDACNKTSGHCPQGCQTGYQPPICNECAEGFFGIKCSFLCHCALGPSDCNPHSGVCPGGCQLGYEGSNCQNLTGFPVIVSVSNDTHNLGENITVSCTAAGLPLPFLTITSRTVEELHTEEPVTNNSSDVHQVSLTSYFAAANSSGRHEFHCIANNTHGSEDTVFDVNVAKPLVLKLPPIVGTVTSDSVSFTWKAWSFSDDDGGLPGDYVQYLPVHRTVGGSLWLSSSVWQNETDAVVGDLKPDTDYEFAVRSRRQGRGGDGIPGPSHQAVTLCGVPNNQSQPLNISAVSVGSDYATISWLAPNLEDVKCGVTAFILTCQMNDGTNVTTILDGHLQEHRLTMLNESTLYVVRLRAATKIGHGTSTEISFHTKSAVPGPVGNLHHEVQPDGYLLKWEAPTNIPATDIVSYHVRAELVSIGSCDTIPSDLESTYVTYTTKRTEVKLMKEDLHADSDYNVTVRSQSIIGIGDITELDMDLPETEPGAQPPKVKVIAEDKRMTFTWDPIPCHLANGDLFYKYSFRKAALSKTASGRKKRSDDWIVKEVETAGNNATFENLKPFTPYEFSVRGVTLAGEGPAFNGTYWTKDALLPPPRMTPTSNVPTEILVLVPPSGGESGKTLRYQLKYSRQDSVDDEKVMVVNSMMTIHWIKNLIPDTFYNLQIRAESRSGWGNWSAIYKQKTKEGVPSEVVDLSYRQINSSAVVVSWLPPNATNGVLRKYKVECRLISNLSAIELGDDWYNVKYEMSQNESLVAVLRGLSIEFQYNVFVTASTAAGFGQAANVTVNLFDPAISRSGDVEWYPGPPTPKAISYRYDNSSPPTLMYTIQVFPNNESDAPKPEFYQILVIDFAADESLRSRDFNFTLFHDYVGAQHRRQAYWICGQLPASVFDTAGPDDVITFEIGNRDLDLYYNAPLITEYGHAFVVRPIKYSEPVAYYMTEPMEFRSGLAPDGVVDVDYVLARDEIGRFRATITWQPPKWMSTERIKWYLVRATLLQDEGVCVGKMTTSTEFKTKAHQVEIPYLYPNSNYSISIGTVSLQLMTSVNLKITTNETAPSKAPESVKVYETSATSTSVSWNAIPCHAANGRVAYRYCLCHTSPENQSVEICPAEDVATPELFARIDNLNPNTSYIFVVAGATSGGVGPFAEFRFGTEAGAVASSLPFEGCFVLGLPCFWLVIIVVIVLVVFWIILILLICCCKKRRKGHIQKTKISTVCGQISNLPDGNKTGNVWAVTNKRTSEDETTLTGVFEPSSTSMRHTDTFKKSTFFGPIPVKDLCEYINVRTNHPTVNFPEEFKQLSKEKHGSLNVAKKSENIKKNRYGNILPYDQTRVRLDPLPGFPDSDYINASFIDGFGKPKVYIATQGPKENTFHDFWRMVIQEKVAVIVMLTSLIENKKKKCEQYWPNHFRLYGDILVTLTDTVHSADIVLRHFQLKIVGTNEVRFVTHCQYCDWPESEMAPCISSVLDLRRRVRDELPSRAGPMIVHCSGGAGRSGTFIAIDAMLQQAYEEEFVHIFQYVNNIRRQRINLIQTADQYKFIYDAILEALQSGNTTVMCSRFPVYYRDICRSSVDEPSDLANQFNILANFERRKSCYPCPAALSEENANKNRNPEILPVEHSRVRLQSDNSEGVPGTSDPYINAVLCDGFRQKGQFLVTCMPLNETTEDFWHMIIKYRSSIIVMLNDSEFIDEQMVPGQYWPNDGCTQYGPYQVEIVTFEEKGMVNMRTMRITDVRKPQLEPHCVIQLQFLDWSPKDELPGCAASFVAMINMVNVLQRKFGGPITVHCANGATRSGIFCVCHVIKEHIETGEVDVFQAVKRVRRHRPQLITSGDQYKFCYEAALELAIDYNEKALN